MMNVMIYCFLFGLLHLISAKTSITTSQTFHVDKKPHVGYFTSIQGVINFLPQRNDVRVIIKVHAGVYTEKVNIPQSKSFITIEGVGADNTIVQWGDTAGTRGPGGGILGTNGSATFSVNSPYFIARNITFKNTAPAPLPGAIDKQGVAVMISGDAAMFIGCKILGAQDTLYVKFGRHYFKDCFIEGFIDFIFGNGRSFFEGCHIYSIAQSSGTITAQRRFTMSENAGFSFVNCKITGSGHIFLGRPWREPFSLVVFTYTYMENIIVPEGWNDWNHPNYHSTIFYAEYKCSGPGARREGRVKWSKELSDKEAEPFTSIQFINGSQWVKI